MLRCKYNCTSINEGTTHYTYHLSAVYGSEENRQYWESTPSGSFQATIAKAKGKLFEVGKEYYIDISEAVAAV